MKRKIDRKEDKEDEKEDLTILDLFLNNLKVAIRFDHNLSILFYIILKKRIS